MSVIDLMQDLWPSPNWTQPVVDLWHERLTRPPLNKLDGEQVRAVLGQAKMDGLNPHSARGQKRESDANQILARLHEVARAKAPPRETVSRATGEVIPALTLEDVDARIAAANERGWPAWIVAEYQKLRRWLETGVRPSLRVPMPSLKLADPDGYPGDDAFVEDPPF